MKNFQIDGLQELSVNEMRDLNGGFICGGVCITLIAAALLVASTTPAY